jgi:hypothetical protein
MVKIPSLCRVFLADSVVFLERLYIPSKYPSFENLIFEGIFPISANGKIDVNRSFKKSIRLHLKRIV